MSFDNKVIVITGASDGIGAALARQLAAEKAKLVLAARRLDALQSVVTECEAAGAAAVAVRCDVSVEADCKALATSAIAHFDRIDSERSHRTPDDANARFVALRATGVWAVKLSIGVANSGAADRCDRLLTV